MEQSPLKEEIRMLIVELTAYLETKFEIARLGAVETTALVATLVLTGFVFLLLGLMALLFLSLAVALYLAWSWNQQALGFAVVGAFYLVLALLGYALRDKLFRKPLLRTVIRLMLPDDMDTTTPKA